SSHDVVIAVMGATGCGKSTFVSTLVGHEVGIGHGLKAWLIDTPGFNDTTLGDAEVLRSIAFLLARTYEVGVRLAGIVYLHRITDVRVGGSGKRMMQLIRDMCGAEAFPRLVLATTMWQELGSNDPAAFDLAVQHEMELRRTDEFWGAMCRGGSRLARWDGSRASAMAMVDRLQDLQAEQGPMALQIQREMVGQRLDLADTAAGRTVGAKAAALADRFRAEMAEADRQFQEEDEGRRNTQALTVSAVRAECERQVAEAEKARDALQVDYDELLRQKVAECDEVLQKIDREATTVQAAVQERERESAAFVREEPQFEELFQTELEYNEARLKKLDQEIAELRSTGLQEDLEKALEEHRRVDECYREFLAQFKARQVAQRVRDGELASLREEGTRLKKLQVALKGFGVLAGIGLIVAGAVTGIVPLISSGGSLTIGAARSMRRDFANSRPA
ncbi:hypothetical protein B0T26DRAFT_656556, partial [Lasiosphaeria miniovina]